MGKKNILIVMVMIVVILSAKPLYPWFNRPIATVKVKGDLTHVQWATIKKRVLPYLNQRFFNIDLHAIRRSLLKEAWLDKVHIQRKWPNILQLALTEEKPVALWNEVAFVNMEGQRFQPDTLDMTEALPQFSGPDGSEKQMIAMYHVLELQLKPLGLSVDSLELTDRNTWSFHIKTVAVEMGAKNLDKITRFKKLYKVFLMSLWSEVQSVDLRYNKGVAVGWKHTGGRREVLH